MTFSTLIRRPSAYLPIVLSLMACAVVLSHIAVAGVTPEADEGTAAHIFQLLLAGEVPIVLYFALHWVRAAPRPAAPILVLQGLAALMALSPVYVFHL